MNIRNFILFSLLALGVCVGSAQAQSAIDGVYTGQLKLSKITPKILRGRGKITCTGSSYIGVGMQMIQTAPKKLRITNGSNFNASATMKGNTFVANPVKIGQTSWKLTGSALNGTSARYNFTATKNIGNWARCTWIYSGRVSKVQ